MNCPKCLSYNEVGNAFCVNCGETFGSSDEAAPTVIRPIVPVPVIPPDPNPSLPTVFHGQFEQSLPPQAQPPVYPTSPGMPSAPQIYPTSPGIPPQGQQIYFQTSPGQPNAQPSFAAFQQQLPYAAQAAPPKSRLGLAIGIVGVALVFLAAAAGLAVYYFGFKPTSSTESFPTTNGFFLQSADKTKLTDIKKREFKDLAAARDDIGDDSSLPLSDSKPSLILNGGSKEVPVGDLRLIEVGSIKDDGNLKHLEYRTSAIEGKNDMKRISFDNELAPGKYAFAVFDGPFENGKHTLWPFEVRGGSKKDNGDLAKTLTIARKSKTTSTPSGEKSPDPTQTVEPPKNASVAYCQISNVVLRSGPTQASSKIGSIRSGQKLYVIEYSGAYEQFVTKDGRVLNSNYAHVQTESGKRGWVYAAFLK